MPLALWPWLPVSKVNIFHVLSCLDQLVNLLVIILAVALIRFNFTSDPFSVVSHQLLSFFLPGKCGTLVLGCLLHASLL